MAPKLRSAEVRGDFAFYQKCPTVVIEDPGVRDSSCLIFPARLFSWALLFNNLDLSSRRGAAGCPASEPLEKIGVLGKSTDKRVCQAVFGLLVLRKNVAHWGRALERSGH
jgi:hypothetical protein